MSLPRPDLAVVCALVALYSLVAACSGPAPADPAPVCVPTSATELGCSDGRDDDCDGYTDCLDSECGGQTCADDGSTCVAGGCLCPDCALPGLPELQNVRLTMHGDTAIIDFEPFEGALDYRVYPLPAADAWHVDQTGALVVPDAIYRCGGDRPLIRREDDPAGGVDRSLAGTYFGYQRSEAESVLGYVYLTPGPGRQPVYRVGEPDGKGGYTWEYVAQPASEFSSADYVVGAAARDALLAAGGRDDGIAFYAPDDGTTPVYRAQLTPNDYSSHPVLYLTDGAEHDQRAGDAQVVDLAERFRVLAAEEPDTVALHRVTYDWGNTFDVLAAGEPRFQRVLHQGNDPMWSVTWSGLGAETTLVVEALDAGCPFAGGYIGAVHADADESNPYPSITVDEARLPGSGEVFVNGQHDPASRPRPIARAYVQATPEAPPEMEFYESFAAPWAPLETTTEDSQVRIRRNDRFVVEYAGCTTNDPIGPVLGQLAFGGGDWGSSCNMSIIPRTIQPELAAGSFLHARMSTELPSSGRRYPQILITTVPVVESGSQPHSYDEPVRSRLGPLPFETDYQPGSGSERTLVVQPFGSNHELQIEFCDRRGWGVNVQCQRANLHGYHAGTSIDDEEWSEPWRPVPVLGDVAGFDRPVQLDVYASTDRVYVFADDKPAGCAVLPAGHMPAGPVTVVFGAVIYHGAIDESVVPEHAPHQFMRTFLPDYYTRRLDDVGIDRAVPAPAWDEAILPCGTRWYGGDL